MVQPADPGAAGTGAVPVDPPGVLVAPVVVVSRSFPARPASWVEAQDFVAGALAGLDLEPGAPRVIQDSIGEALLASARPGVGSFQVAVRIFPDEVQVEVLGSEDQAAVDGYPPVPTSFAAWIGAVLQRQGLSQEAAARRLGVSVRTVGRWVRGRSEPRLRELRRVHEVFGRGAPG